MGLSRPLAEAAAVLEVAIGDRGLLASSEGPVWTVLGGVAAEHVRADPDLACYVGGLLGFLDLNERADELLDWLRDAGPDLALRAENIRGALAAARGDTERAVAVWDAALRDPSAAAAEPARRNQVRINLLLAYLSLGLLPQAQACLAEVAARTVAAGDPQGEVRSGLAELALETWLTGGVPGAERLEQLDRLPSFSLSDVAQLAALYFEIAAASRDWTHAERAVDVLETTTQRLSGILGASHPQALAARVLLTSAEARWALAAGDLGRTRHAVAMLAHTTSRCAEALGSASLRALKARIEYALVMLDIGAVTHKLPDVQQALRTLTDVVAIATEQWGAGNQLVSSAQRHLYDARVFGASLLGLDSFLIPAPPPVVFEGNHPGLAVAPLSADEHSIHITVSWDELASGVVRIRRAGDAPPWPPGTRIPAFEIDRYGEELHGDWKQTAEGTRFEAVLPRKHRFCTVFAVSGGWAVTGQARKVELTPPPIDVELRRIGERALASWIWPTGVRLAHVDWETPEKGKVRKRVTAASYAADGGCSLGVGAGGGLLTVRTIGVGVVGAIISDPVAVAVDGVAGEVGYEFVRPKGLGVLRPRRRVLRLTADREFTAVEVTVVASDGPAPPDGRRDGMPLLHETGVRLHPGRTTSFVLDLPSGRTAPYWLRCFVTGPEPLTTVDPSIAELRITV